MKNQLKLAATLAALLMLAFACTKKEEPVAPTPEQTGESPPAALQKAVTTAQGQTEVVKQAVQGTVTNVQAQSDALAGQVQGLIDNAKKLISENKWSEALTLLDSLSTQKLTPEQQSLVQSLKDQAQKAVQDAAAKTSESVGGLLQPKK